jgi:DNA-binding NarL/FixJ family response regulator
VIRVFLLDDHEVVRRGLVALLEATGEIEVVGESGSALEAARRIPAFRPGRRGAGRAVAGRQRDRRVP